jgi:glycosyltransferase involved in cell wall biosynthesis
MSVRLGIGVVTYNRRALVAETVARVLAHTVHPFSLVVADDGSDDGTAEAERARGVIVASGSNMGIAWNKNRALFYLMALVRCDVAVLLEDDSFPDTDGWEREWIEGAQRWGHTNIAGGWFQDSFLSGAGTADDPFRSVDVSAQCSAYSREAILFGGYLDSRFKGYGFEHVEHSVRLIRHGYGGEYRTVSGIHRPVHMLIRGGIKVTHPPSYGNADDIARNEALCQQLLRDQSYRAPWYDDTGMAQFRAEMRSTAGGRI